MQIALCQLNFHTGNFKGNLEQILVSIQEAREAGAELVVFPELAVCGYPPRDFLEFPDFLQQCRQVTEAVKKQSKGMAVLLGAPTPNALVAGKALFNSALLYSNGALLAEAHKILLPNYDIFDEVRYFESGPGICRISWNGIDLAITICEDIWNLSTPALYHHDPIKELAKDPPQLLLNIAASPFSLDQKGLRTQVLKVQARRLQCPIVYVNHVGAQTELIFDGGSQVMDEKGTTLFRAPDFTKGTFTAEVPISPKPPKDAAKSFNPPHIPGIRPEDGSRSKGMVLHREGMELAKEALVLGIRDYFRKSGFSKAVLGLSGGIDSALVYVLACEALGREQVLAALLPSEYSSAHSIDDAMDLVKAVGGRSVQIPIQPLYQAALKVLEDPFGDPKFGLAHENLQSRARGMLLMALSNKHGYILLNTTNKSEAAVGYGTLYGDLCGGLSVIGDLYKVQVQAMCQLILKNGSKVLMPGAFPENILNKPPSAELRPDQKDSDSLPPYEVLDPILFQYIEGRKGLRAIAEQGYDHALVQKVINLVNSSEWKRHQTPPILRISSKAFGMGRRMPIVAQYNL